MPGRGYSHTLPIRVCAAQRGSYFEAPDYFGGARSKGFATLRNVLMLPFFDKSGQKLGAVYISGTGTSGRVCGDLGLGDARRRT